MYIIYFTAKIDTFSSTTKNMLLFFTASGDSQEASGDRQEARGDSQEARICVKIAARASQISLCRPAPTARSPTKSERRLRLSARVR